MQDTKTKEGQERNLGHGREVLHVHVTKPVVLVLVGITVLPWVLAAAGFLVWKASVGARTERKVPTLTLPGERVTYAKPGPWGEIEFIRIAIEPPDEFIDVGDLTEKPAWFFGRHTRLDVEAFLKDERLTAEQRSALLETTPWEEGTNGIVLHPGADLVLGLGNEARERIYSLLALFPENRPQAAAFSFKPALLQERLELSGVTRATIDLLTRLLYRNGDLLMFADMNLVLPRLPDDRERLRFVKTVSRKTTLMGSLKVDADSDVDKLASYWGFDGRSKDIRPLLESLRRVPGGASLDLAHLLPPFARRRIYTYPLPSTDPVVNRRDCHWTSLNFFNEQPEDRFTDLPTVLKAIETDYFQIGGGARLGDLVLLVTRDERVVHSAVYVADDVVFTKNDAVFTQPWMLMRMPDLLDFYQAFQRVNEPLRIRFYREKDRRTAGELSR